MRKMSRNKRAAGLTEEAMSELKSLLSNFRKKYDIIDEDLQQILEQADKETVAVEKDKIPVCIFNNCKLSSLEAIVKYLKENLNLNYSQIAGLLSRNPGPIGITYRNAKRKMVSRFTIIPCINIRVSIFRNRNLSMLENLVIYLKKLGMRFHQIAVLINRDDRTVWTVNHRAELKLTSKSKKKK